MEKYQPSTHREKQTGRSISTSSPSAHAGSYTRPPRAVGNANQPRS